jgi:integrase
VNALASLVPDRFQALILLATFAGLRWGEVTALRRRDLDLSARIVRVALVHVESAAGQLSVGAPKSRAGERTVAFPSALVPALTRHLDSYVGPEPDALVFNGSEGRHTAARQLPKARPVGRGDGKHRRTRPALLRPAAHRGNARRTDRGQPPRPDAPHRS